MTESPMLSTVQAAAMLGMSRPSVLAYINSGRLEAYQYEAGGQHRIPQAAVEAFMEGCRVRAAGPEVLQRETLRLRRASRMAAASKHAL